MAKSIRSKQRQRVLRVRRKKFGERERLKAWEHHYEIAARKSEISGTREKTKNEPSTPSLSVPNQSVVDSTVVNNDNQSMEVDVKITKKDIAKWALSRNQRKKLAKLKKLQKRKAKKSSRQKCQPPIRI